MKPLFLLLFILILNNCSHSLEFFAPIKNIEKKIYIEQDRENLSVALKDILLDNQWTIFQKKYLVQQKPKYILRIYSFKNNQYINGSFAIDYEISLVSYKSKTALFTLRGLDTLDNILEVFQNTLYSIDEPAKTN